MHSLRSTSERLREPMTMPFVESLDSKDSWHKGYSLSSFAVVIKRSSTKLELGLKTSQFDKSEDSVAKER